MRLSALALVVVLAACSPAKPGGGRFEPTNIPGWVETYPSGTITQTALYQTPRGVAGTIDFSTTDSPQQVLDFYRQSAAREGFKPGGLIPGSSYTDPSTGRSFAIDPGASVVGQLAVKIVVQPGWR
jgi:hypothetical protein